MDPLLSSDTVEAIEAWKKSCKSICYLQCFLLFGALLEIIYSQNISSIFLVCASTLLDIFFYLLYLEQRRSWTVFDLFVNALWIFRIKIFIFFLGWGGFLVWIIGHHNIIDYSLIINSLLYWCTLIKIILYDIEIHFSLT